MSRIIKPIMELHSLIRKYALGILLLLLGSSIFGQKPADAKVELGSQTAKAGFRNEDEIAAKFNNWKADEEARVWLGFMGFDHAGIKSVAASKPHGEKADIHVKVVTSSGTKTEGVSIKLVSTANGFNQIDKRWLKTYSQAWKMPDDVHAALKLYVGEAKPTQPSRDPKRMYINEFSPEMQKKIVEFFTAKKAEIVSDLFSGDGQYSAGWMMVALKSSSKPKWVLRRIDYVIKFYSDGPVEITRQGNLKIGRVTVQRKGGDGGRETANMLQFKMNPALLFEGK